MNTDLSIYTTEFLVIGGCLILSALFSASETAITSLGNLRAKHLVDQNSGSIRQLNLWLHQPGRVLETILIFNNVVNILASAVATNLASQIFQSNALGIATGTMTFLVLVFGEVVPKAFGKAHAETMALPALNFIYFIYVCISPISIAFAEFANWFVKKLGGKRVESPPITEEELEFLINVGERAGVLEESKKDMIVGVFEFDETKVREIMTPRPDVKWLRIDSTFDDAAKLALESGLSRLPICDMQGIDHIIAILLVKDLLKVARAGESAIKNFRLKQFMREPLFIPESKLIMDVFKDLKRTKNHIAVVIDEHGGTAGLVTMEDILEEIVGEIQDEYDSEEAEILELEPGIYDVAGSHNIDEFMEFFELEENDITEKPEEGVDTIAGWITSLLGELPEVGKTVQIGPLNMEVSDIERQRIRRVRVSKVIDRGMAQTLLEV